MTRRAELLQEWLWRDDCRKSLIAYAKTVPIPGVPLTDNYERLLEEGEIDPKFDDGRYDNSILIPQINTAPAGHHLFIYGISQQVIEGTLIAPDGTVCKRAMFMTPPGAAKSTCLDVVIPSWAMGRYGHEIILLSNADMIAKKHGRRARQLCQSPEFWAIFERGINKDAKAADNWELDGGGRYLAAGIYGAYMGQRADGLVPDDILKGRRAAESQTERDNAWETYVNDARTRKKPTAWELFSGTRWHEDDVMGRILPEGWAGESGFIKGRDGYWWYVVCLQAQVETNNDPLGRAMGDYLWPEWFNDGGDPERYWRPLKMDQRSWSSLYQQVPTPPDGEFFKQEHVRYYTHLPDQMTYFVTADYGTQDPERGGSDKSDFSSIGLWGVDGEGMGYFITGWHGQKDSTAWVEIALDFVEMKSAIAHVAGAGTIRRMSEGPLTVRMRKRKVFTELVWYPETYSKGVNAEPFRMMMMCGMILWPKENEEAEWIIRHLLGFGTLKIDDPVDMCSMFGQHMKRLWGPAKPKVEEAPPIVVGGEIRMADVIKRRKKKSW